MPDSLTLRRLGEEVREANIVDLITYGDWAAAGFAIFNIALAAMPKFKQHGNDGAAAWAHEIFFFDEDLDHSGRSLTSELNSRQPVPSQVNANEIHSHLGSFRINIACTMALEPISDSNAKVNARSSANE